MICGNKPSYFGRKPPLKKIETSSLKRGRFRYWLNGDIIPVDGATNSNHRIIAAQLLFL
jgi:hypothetical protein